MNASSTAGKSFEHPDNSPLPSDFLVVFSNGRLAEQLTSGHGVDVLSTLLRAIAFVLSLMPEGPFDPEKSRRHVRRIEAGPTDTMEVVEQQVGDICDRPSKKFARPGLPPTQDIDSPDYNKLDLPCPKLVRTEAYQAADETPAFAGSPASVAEITRDLMKAKVDISNHFLSLPGESIGREIRLCYSRFRNQVTPAKRAVDKYGRVPDFGIIYGNKLATYASIWHIMKKGASTQDRSITVQTAAITEMTESLSGRRNPRRRLARRGRPALSLLEEVSEPSSPEKESPRTTRKRTAEEDAGGEQKRTRTLPLTAANLERLSVSVPIHHDTCYDQRRLTMIVSQTQADNGSTVGQSDNRTRVFRVPSGTDSTDASDGDSRTTGEAAAIAAPAGQVGPTRVFRVPSYTDSTGTSDEDKPPADTEAQPIPTTLTEQETARPGPWGGAGLGGQSLLARPKWSKLFGDDDDLITPRGPEEVALYQQGFYRRWGTEGIINAAQNSSGASTSAASGPAEEETNSPPADEDTAAPEAASPSTDADNGSFESSLFVDDATDLPEDDEPKDSAADPEPLGPEGDMGSLGEVQPAMSSDTDASLPSDPQQTGEDGPDTASDSGPVTAAPPGPVTATPPGPVTAGPISPEMAGSPIMGSSTQPMDGSDTRPDTPSATGPATAIPTGPVTASPPGPVTAGPISPEMVARSPDMGSSTQPTDGSDTSSATGPVTASPPGPVTASPPGPVTATPTGPDTAASPLSTPQPADGSDLDARPATIDGSRMPSPTSSLLRSLRQLTPSRSTSTRTSPGRPRASPRTLTPRRRRSEPLVRQLFRVQLKRKRDAKPRITITPPARERTSSSPSFERIPSIGQLTDEEIAGFTSPTRPPTAELTTPAVPWRQVATTATAAAAATPARESPARGSQSPGSRRIDPMNFDFFAGASIPSVRRAPTHGYQRTEVPSILGTHLELYGGTPVSPNRPSPPGAALARQTPARGYRRRSGNRRLNALRGDIDWRSPTSPNRPSPTPSAAFARQATAQRSEVRGISEDQNPTVYLGDASRGSIFPRAASPDRLSPPPVAAPAMPAPEHGDQRTEVRRDDARQDDLLSEAPASANRPETPPPPSTLSPIQQLADIARNMRDEEAEAAPSPPTLSPIQQLADIARNMRDEEAEAAPSPPTLSPIQQLADIARNMRDEEAKATPPSPTLSPMQQLAEVACDLSPEAPASVNRPPTPPPPPTLSPVQQLAEMARNMCGGEAEVAIRQENGRLVVQFQLPDSYASVFPAATSETASTDEAPLTNEAPLTGATTGGEALVSDPLPSSAEQQAVTSSAGQQAATPSAEQKAATQSAEQKATTSSAEQQATTSSAEQKAATSPRMPDAIFQDADAVMEEAGLPEPSATQKPAARRRSPLEPRSANSTPSRSASPRSQKDEEMGEAKPTYEADPPAIRRSARIRNQRRAVSPATGAVEGRRGGAGGKAPSRRPAGGSTAKRGGGGVAKPTKKKSAPRGTRSRTG
ncbi:hypothetical protein CDD80_5232 [Ophiocordyceps camponoti-rufipedis]|uniref:Uncharacterized protein n=1 Tax=Ophiocordyceps camponoti-rufipedis TaxID=2004952 RepID=A0A2C5YVF8_9HYPO|nr:hypothetical protein CDD80_5232 [Ophiocordyceps camponoti-rufipedis]